jgi:hypothetical protein
MKVVRTPSGSMPTTDDNNNKPSMGNFGTGCPFTIECSQTKQNKTKQTNRERP